jgi:uncharacterized caspase-like protein
MELQIEATDEGVLCIVHVRPPGAGQARTKSAFSALVIGNNVYSGDVGPLSQPGDDARDMSELLTAKGYEVVLLVNGTKEDMLAGLSRFAATLHDGCTGVVFFSGHGFSCQTAASVSDSYLVPVDGTFLLQRLGE